VDLCGNRAFPGAVLAQYQHWAIAFSDPGNHTLNSRIRRRAGFACRFHFGSLQLLP